MSRAKPAPDSMDIEARQHLQMGGIIELKKNEAAYTGGSDLFYMVVSGRIKIVRQDSEEASQAVIAFRVQDEFFGESILVNERIATESAYATEPTQLMAWGREDIMRTISTRPELAVALMQVYIRRTLQLEERVQTLCCDSIGKRIGRGVVDLARRMGKPVGGRSKDVEITNISHLTLGQYVGVSRESTSIHMAQYKEAGHVNYERNGTIRVNPAAFTAVLDGMA